MKTTVIDAKTTLLAFASEGYFEEVFIRDMGGASIPYLAIDQDGSEIQIPVTSELREFAAFLIDIADKKGL